MRQERDRIAEAMCIGPHTHDQCPKCKRNPVANPAAWSATPDKAPWIVRGACWWFVEMRGVGA